MGLLKEHNHSNLPLFFNLLEVAHHRFDLNRCDEKTFYITVELKYNSQKVLCDFIYIMDKKEVYGAISINEHYQSAKKFFSQHFNHALLYSDELVLAKNFTRSFYFQQSLKQFACKYPKYMTRHS